MTKRILTALCFSCLIVLSCKHKPFVPDDTSGFPAEVGKIFLNKCATAGCHNAASYTGAGGLLLDSWEHLFNGGNNGAAIVPYSVDYSPLLYFINTDSSLGVVAEPTMPKDNPPLTREEYLTIREWIARGAPDKNNNIPFASNADTRQKIYVSMQACDVIGVIDAEKKVVMRYIQIGESAVPETPHAIRVSPDSRYLYVSLTAGSVLQKIETATDKIIDNIDLKAFAPASWNVFAISDDNTKFMLTDFKQGSAGRLIYIDIIAKTKQIFNNIASPHGVVSNSSFDTFYVTSQYGNVVYKLSQDGFINEQISLDGGPPITTSTPTSPDPHEIIMSPDRSKCFITCERTNQVKVLSTANDSVINTYNVGVKPQEIAISKNYPYLFVTCMEDPSPFSTNDVKFRGAVYRINYQTGEVRKIEGKFSAVHGIAVDDKSGTVFFASRNVGNGGPLPHHTSSCGGSNGFYNVYDIQTLQPADSRRFEVLPDPYSADSRFK